MEGAPAVYAGTVFVLFGAALMLWTGTRTARRRPVTPGAGPVAAAAAALAGAVFLLIGVWCLLQV